MDKPDDRHDAPDTVTSAHQEPIAEQRAGRPANMAQCEVCKSWYLKPVIPPAEHKPI